MKITFTKEEVLNIISDCVDGFCDEPSGLVPRAAFTTEPPRTQECVEVRFVPPLEEEVE